MDEYLSDRMHDEWREYMAAPASTAKALALAISGAAALAFPSAAQAFTQKQCNLMMTAFDQHTAANFQHYSPTDKIELGKFASWVTGTGCTKGEPIVLVRHPEVGAALSVVQMFVNRAQDVSLRVALSPTVSFVPASTAAASVRPTTVSATERDGASAPLPARTPGG